MKTVVVIVIMPFLSTYWTIVQGLTQITFPCEIPVGSHEEFLRATSYIIVMCRVLETSLIRILRFQFGQTYSVSVSNSFALSDPSQSKARPGEFTATIEFLV